MITEQDLKEAIMECQGQRHPNANTCIKLAAYLTIQRELYGGDEGIEEPEPIPQYSYASAYEYKADTPLADVIKGKDMDDVMSVIDELVDALQILNPKLYENVMRKLRDL